MLETPEVIEPQDLSVDPMLVEAQKRADKVIKKNKRELDRLRKHANHCLLTLNKDGYIYSIGKIRQIIKKPLSYDELGVLYDTSLERIVQLARELIEGKEGE